MLHVERKNICTKERSPDRPAGDKLDLEGSDKRDGLPGGADLGQVEDTDGAQGKIYRRY